MKTHLSREIDKVVKKILLLAAEVEINIQTAGDVFLSGDKETALEIINGDDKIDNMEIDIEEECLKILALYQPVAQDLRLVVAILKINDTLERIGDLAANIAKSTRHIEYIPEDFVVKEDFELMITTVIANFKRTLELIITPETSGAIDIIRNDDAIDKLNKKILVMLSEEVLENHSAIPYCIECIYVTRTIERIGDLITNIAEDILYMISGEIARHREF